MLAKKVRGVHLQNGKGDAAVEPKDSAVSPKLRSSFPSSGSVAVLVVHDRSKPHHCEHLHHTGNGTRLAAAESARPRFAQDGDNLWRFLCLGADDNAWLQATLFVDNYGRIG